MFADRKFAKHPILQWQLMSAMRAATAASKSLSERPEWAVLVSRSQLGQSELLCCGDCLLNMPKLDSHRARVCVKMLHCNGG